MPFTDEFIMRCPRRTLWDMYKNGAPLSYERMVAWEEIRLRQDLEKNGTADEYRRMLDIPEEGW